MDKIILTLEESVEHCNELIRTGVFGLDDLKKQMELIELALRCSKNYKALGDEMFFYNTTMAESDWAGGYEKDN